MTQKGSMDKLRSYRLPVQTDMHALLQAQKFTPDDEDYSQQLPSELLHYHQRDKFWLSL